MLKTPELYDIWNEEKKKIQFSKKKRGKRVLRGEIWIAKIGMNIGNEISKDGNFSRPVLILRDHLGGDLVLIIPFTTETSLVDQDFRVLFEDWKKYGLVSPSFLVTNHIQSISTKRLVKKLNNRLQSVRKIEKIPEEILFQIEEKIIQYLCPEQKNNPKLQ